MRGLHALSHVSRLGVLPIVAPILVKDSAGALVGSHLMRIDDEAAMARYGAAIPLPLPRYLPVVEGPGRRPRLGTMSALVRLLAPAQTSPK